MTLVLTWLFPFGIVMGADSALTQKVTDNLSRTRYRVLTGFRKVHWIPKIQAGVSCWGTGITEDNNCVTDFWLSDFITSNVVQCNTIHDFAILLQDELRKKIPEISAPEGSIEFRYGNSGFHLAGFLEYKKRKIPTFYHIHNGQSEVFPDIEPRIVNANQDFPPERVSKLFSKGIAPHVRNGDFFVYSTLFQHLQELFDQLEKELKIGDEPFRLPDYKKFASPLEAYAEFVRFWIRIVRDMYALSNVPEIISGDISILAITPHGNSNFSRKP